MRLGLMLVLLFSIPQGTRAQLTLLKDGHSAYSIVLPDRPGSVEKQAALVLQQYIQKVSGCQLAIQEESQSRNSHSIYIGQTRSAEQLMEDDLPSEGFRIQVKGTGLYFQGTGKGLLYGIYDFIENQLGCRKWEAGAPAVCPELRSLRLAGTYRIEQTPAFQYREVYFPAELDLEYVNWHKIHRLEDLWGWWGHTFSRLVPPSYFKNHPEYFSYFNGARRPNQLCLSHPEVLKIAIASLEKAIKAHPEATFWSISPNDDPAFCECSECQAVDKQEGGPQGSLIRFVNKIAARFPEHHFTTLAYLSTAAAPRITRPGTNVTVMLSNIDAYRSHPIGKENSAATFREQLSAWVKQSPRVFLWDYYTQFTNFLAPFPVSHTFADNLRFYQEMGAQGVFAQGSGESYSDMAEMKSYLLAKLLWNPRQDADSLRRAFIQGFYGKAAPQVEQYLERLEHNVKSDTLNIYGNPVNDHRGYLSPEHMDAYSTLMDQAAARVENEPKLLERVRRIRLSQEYTYLQQARFYGIRKHGIFQQDESGNWVARPGMAERIRGFVSTCIAQGVTELSEGGPTPKDYKTEWEQILAQGVRPTLALGCRILPGPYAYVPEYPARGWETLVDGNPGYDDFSYNWLCFYGKPMEVTLDLQAVQDIGTISLDFLQDARHWIFLPEHLEIWGSRDGKTYESLGAHSFTTPEGDYQIRKNTYTLALDRSFRFIKVAASPPRALPDWRYHRHKQAMIACDEIWITTKTNEL